MRTIRVLLSCPLDLGQDKDAIASVIDGLRPRFQTSLGLLIETVRHEFDTSPGLGRDAMDVVESTMISRPFDLYVGLFSDRLGPGTIREFEISRARAAADPLNLPAVFFYLLKPAGGFPKSVEQFRDGFPGLCFQVDSTAQLQSMFQAHLVEFLLGIQSGSPQLAALKLVSHSSGSVKFAAVLEAIRSGCLFWLRDASGAEIETLKAACAAICDDAPPACLCDAAREVVHLFRSETVHTGDGPIVDGCRCDRLAAVLRWACTLALPNAPSPQSHLAHTQGLKLIERRLKPCVLPDANREAQPGLLGGLAPVAFSATVSLGAPADEHLVHTTARRFLEFVWKRVLQALPGLGYPSVRIQREAAALPLEAAERDAASALIEQLESELRRLAIDHYGQTQPLTAADFLPLPHDSLTEPFAIAADPNYSHRLVFEMEGERREDCWTHQSQFVLDPATWPAGAAVRWTLEQDRGYRVCVVRSGRLAPISDRDQLRLQALESLDPDAARTFARALGLFTRELSRMWPAIGASLAAADDLEWARAVLASACRQALHHHDLDAAEACTRAWDACAPPPN